MNPHDANGKLPTSDRPFRVLVLSGSNRRQFDCPSADSKSRALMFRMSDRLPTEWEIDLEDLGNVWNRAQIRSCNGCVSSSMALCVWPCNCYERGNRGQPDLMWDLDLYARLDLADAWAIIGPVNWYGPSSNLKVMFDRLVCMNGGNPKEALIGHKDPARAIELERSPEWKELSKNHLEGRSAGFFCYGDGGGDELLESGRPKTLRHPEYFDPEHEPFEEMRDTYAPLVWQTRYSGIEVPDALWKYVPFGVGARYSQAQAEHMVNEPQLLMGFDQWADAFVAHTTQKGKVPPGKYRAYGHKPNVTWMDHARLGVRDMRMSLGIPRSGSSPAIQQEQDLNHDSTLRHKRGEGEKLR